MAAGPDRLSHPHGRNLALLAGAALLNAAVPILLAPAIDHLSVDHAALAAPVAILSGYIVLQWLARMLNESRWALHGRSISGCSAASRYA